MDIRKLKLDNEKLAIVIVVLFCACIAISWLGFKFKWGVWPDFSDILMGTTLLAPFSIPKAFADILGITNPHSTRGVLPMMVVFWPIVLFLLWSTFRTRSVAVFALLALVSLVASANWQIVATGMMGI